MYFSQLSILLSFQNHRILKQFFIVFHNFILNSIVLRKQNLSFLLPRDENGVQFVTYWQCKTLYKIIHTYLTVLIICNVIFHLDFFLFFCLPCTLSSSKPSTILKSPLFSGSELYSCDPLLTNYFISSGSIFPYSEVKIQ